MHIHTHTHTLTHTYIYAYLLVFFSASCLIYFFIIDKNEKRKSKPITEKTGISILIILTYDYATIFYIILYTTYIHTYKHIKKKHT